MERWKDIKGFPGYQVSDTGRVRSRINNRHGVGTEYHELKPVNGGKQNRKSVQLGRGNRRSIHRLVAEAFIPNPNNHPLVRHLDDNPENNSVENLAWGTQTDNMQDCVKHGRLVGDTRAAIEATRCPVRAISMDGSVYRDFISIQDAARSLNVWPQHICSVLQGKIRQTGGWFFERLESGDSYD